MSEGTTVAVTGPTGEIGKAFLRALDASDEVGRVIGMARRPFDPAGLGLSAKVEYRQGDVTKPDDVAALVDGADAVVHLAFIIKAAGSGEDINLRGSRNVFEAAAAAGTPRLVYASSVAAYGFHADNPDVLSEDVPPRGSERFAYSRQKGALEDALHAALAGSETRAWVFRPCIVAGPDAPLLLSFVPYRQARPALRALGSRVPFVKPVLPDPGVPFQLVHHDDVAQALVAGALGKGEPGVYNLAGAGELTVRDLADALGYATVPVPRAAVGATAGVVTRLPFLPAEAEWVSAFTKPVLMDTTKARRLLGWTPRYDGRETLRQTVAASA